MAFWCVGMLPQLLKTSPLYMVIESTLQFDNVGVVQGLLPLLRAVQRSRMWSRKQRETAWEQG